MRQLQQLTSDDEREQAADSLAVELMTLLMGVRDRAADGLMDDTEPAAAWPVLDTLRRILDEMEGDMMDSLADGRTNQEASDLTDGRYATRQSFHKRRKVLKDAAGTRRTLTMDYRRGAAVPKPKPSPVQPKQESALLCGADWGICPDHGNTLTSSGGTTRCKTPGCGLTWEYDRVNHHCNEPARWTVRDAEGGSGLMCPAHALDARTRITGATMTAL